MSQVPLHTDTMVFRLGAESTFGTTSSNMIRLLLSGPQTPLAGLATEMLPASELQPHMETPTQPLRALKRGGKVGFKFRAKRIATRLITGTTPVAYSNASALSHQIIFAHWFGGEHIGAGSTTSGALLADVSTITVTSGTPFAVGQIIGIVEDAAGLRPYLVTSVATNDLGIWPNLRGAVASGNVVTNSYTYYRAEAHSGPPLTLEEANYESGTPANQRRARGVYGQCKMTLDVGQSPVVEFSGESSDHDGPGNLSIPLTAASDDMGAEIGAWTPEVCFQTGATFGIYTCKTFSIEVPNNWHFLVKGNGPGARDGAVRVSAKTGPATWEMTLVMDPAEYAAFVADTARYLMVYTTVGTGTSARIFGALIARAAMNAEPSKMEDNGLAYVKLTGLALQDSATAGSPAASTSTDMSRSPVRLFLL